MSQNIPAADDPRAPRFASEQPGRPPQPGRFARSQDVERPGSARGETAHEARPVATGTGDGDGQGAGVGREPVQVPSSGQAGAARHVRAVPSARGPQQSDVASHQDVRSTAAEDSDRWLDPERVERVRARWHSIQAGFVDDPHQSVEQADALVAKSAELLGEAVAERRRRLSGDGRASDGDSGARTEELRLALRQYRTLLERLLAA